MAKRRSTKKRRLRKVGASPGTLVHIGAHKTDPIRILVFKYHPEGFTESEVATPEEACSLIEPGKTTWINVEGLHNVELVREFGTRLGLHPLTLEDILHTRQRPKLEEYEEYLYAVVRMLNWDGDLLSEQVSLILTPDLVITFQERQGDVFDPVRERIRTGGHGRIRRLGTDYLFYALVDIIVDNYFHILEGMGDQVEELSLRVLADPDSNQMREIQQMKARMVRLRRSVYPLRDVINRIEKANPKLMGPDTGIYLRDVYDHTIQVIESVETLRDSTSGLVDLYLSSVSNRMNEIMKVLTIIATIFIPLTFIAGIYGMNFENMPELKWPPGYFAALTLMLLIAAGMVYYFRRKGWL